MRSVLSVVKQENKFSLKDTYRHTNSAKRNEDIHLHKTHYCYYCSIFVFMSPVPKLFINQLPN